MDGSPGCILAVDLGTSECKASLVDTEGRTVQTASREYPTYFPRPGWAEQKPDDWWMVVSATAREVAERAPQGVLGIGVTSHREGVVPVGGDGRPLSNCIVWMDRRSIPQAEALARRLGEDTIYRVAGLRPDPTFTATKLLWLRENQPEVLDRAEVLLPPKDYVVYRMTGARQTDVTLASRTMLFDINTLQWSRKLLEEAGVPEEKLPRVMMSHEVVGHVSEEAAGQLCVPRRTPVISGGGDRPCEALGAGVMGQGEVGVSIGTASVVVTSSSHPVFDGGMRIMVCGHVAPGLRLLEMGLLSTGSVLRWLRDNVFPAQPDEEARRRLYAAMDEACAQIPPGSEGVYFIPNFIGSRAPRWNPRARGVVYGLTFSHTRYHLARAIMEAVAYEVRGLLEIFGEVGLRVERVRGYGGASRSDLWCQILSDVLGSEIEVLEGGNATLLGVAALVLHGLRIEKDLRLFVERGLRVRRVFKPSPLAHESYSEIYARYQMLCDALDPLYRSV